MRTALHVVQISFFSDPQDRLPGELLDAWPTLVDVAEAAGAAGLWVSVVQASAHAAQVDRGGVHYYFLPFGEACRRARAEPASWNWALGELLATLAPDVLHVHGLGFPRDVLSLTALAPDVPIILQDHADRPPRIWRRALWRRELSAVAGVAFCARAQARPFAEAHVLNLKKTPLYEIPESTSRFEPGDRREARRATRLAGDPALLWVGHLNANKDPLTVLDGVSAAARKCPGVQLCCCFGEAPLLREVQHRITADPRLRSRVRLVGRVPHATIEPLMRAADFFVLGSHREGSGYALIEALACGLPPLVTDIPSFRSLSGAVGTLWPCGDAQALCDALLSARADSATRAQVRAHFDLELSLASLGSKLAAMYQNAIECRQRATASMGAA